MPEFIPYLCFQVGRGGDCREGALDAHALATNGAVLDGIPVLGAADAEADRHEEVHADGREQRRQHAPLCYQVPAHLHPQCLKDRLRHLQ